MSIFQVELKKVVDDSYEIEIGFDLKQKLVSDLQAGLLGGVKNLALITDSTVAPLYGEPIAALLANAGYRVEPFVFPSGEEHKTRETKAMLEDAMLEKEFRRDCAVLAVGGGVVTDLAGFWRAPLRAACRLSITRPRCLRRRTLLWAGRRRWTPRAQRI